MDIAHNVWWHITFSIVCTWSFYSALTNSKVHLFTGASLDIAIASVSFYINQFKPTYKIYVADNFKGDVKIFRSTLRNSRLILTNYGVGYITDKEYRNGFRPKVYQNGRDITAECKNMFQGDLAFASMDGKSIGPFSYVGFTVGDNKDDTPWSNLSYVIERNIIDTTIIKN